MELWIRSQSRQNLMKANDIVAEDNKIAVYKENENSTIVGKYKTEERALEVLDEIQKILKPQLILKDSGKIIGTFEDTIIREGATYELKELTTYVYEMPKE